MLLRQYKRVRRELGKKFHYRDIKKVYTIVLFEKSNSVFKSFSKDIYEEIYNICRNSERMMGMFSKELEILDRNTVKLMIDELDEALGEERKKVKAIKQERETLKAEKESLETEMQEAKAEKESLETEMQRTKDEMEAERKRAEEAEKELIRLRAEMEKLRK